MNSISNIKVYTDGMKKSLLDKMFFIDKINSDTFIDYGCADGTMLKFMKSIFPDYNYYGYDICEDMIKLAKENSEGILFSSDWETVSHDVTIENQQTLILSSIIHEIYSYGSHENIKFFWKKVFKTGFKYIVVRDMMLSNTSDKESDINDMIRIINNSEHSRLSEFEDTWGKITNNKNLIHYLLKYRYTDNWNREVKENYLPLTKEHFIKLIPSNYEVIFHEHYILPFLKEQVLKDFGIQLKDNTHFKMILKQI